MRTQINDIPVRFRLSSALRSAAEAKAASEGMNLSEFMRAAVRRELRCGGMSDRFDPNSAMGELAPLIRAAGQGDLAAQRHGCELTLHAMQAAMARGDMVMAQGHAMEMMFWARFAASQGTDDDALMLTAALTHLSRFWTGEGEFSWYGETLLVEATALADRLASRGNEEAAEALNMIARNVAPHILQQAKEVA
ncbi:MAG: hypothetical protein C0494_15820 [Sphingobium sp.]|nr:hypothetical protein [Sphingobium sp.]